jgi:hypothetical protein
MGEQVRDKTLQQSKQKARREFLENPAWKVTSIKKSVVVVWLHPLKEEGRGGSMDSKDTQTQQGGGVQRRQRKATTQASQTGYQKNKNRSLHQKG